MIAEIVGPAAIEKEKNNEIAQRALEAAHKAGIGNLPELSTSTQKVEEIYRELDKRKIKK